MSVSNKGATSAEAKEAVRKYFNNSAHPTAGPLLQWLEMQGYVIIQRPYEKPARRGNSAGVMLGKSHTATIVGGAT